MGTFQAFSFHFMNTKALNPQRPRNTYFIFLFFLIGFGGDAEYIWYKASSSPSERREPENKYKTSRH